MVPGLEVKFAGGAPVLTDGQVIEGYASLFGMTDQGGDAVAPGAFGASLARLAAKGDKVRMLWQHDPAKPIGVWDEIREDEKGTGQAGPPRAGRGRVVGSVAGHVPDAARGQGGPQGRGRPARGGSAVCGCGRGFAGLRLAVRASAHPTDLGRLGDPKAGAAKELRHPRSSR